MQFSCSCLKLKEVGGALAEPFGLTLAEGLEFKTAYQQKLYICSEHGYPVLFSAEQNEGDQGE